MKRLSFPVVRVREVWHVGTEPTMGPPRPRFSDSLEGPLLSVTTVPDAWIHIVQMGGNPCWLLEGPGRFVDVHRLGPLGLDRAAASRPDLARRVQRWQARWWDSEMESVVAMEVETCDEAELEATDREEAYVGRVQSWKATRRLQALWRRAGLEPPEGQHVAEAVLIEVVRGVPDLDGLWWNDRLDPLALSAPRGGILPERLGRWRWRELDCPEEAW